MGVLSKMDLEMLGSEKERTRFYCLNCGEKILNSNWASGVMPSGFWSGPATTFLCADCAHHNDLNVLGALIGDALIAYNFNQMKKPMSTQLYHQLEPLKYVDKFMYRLNASINKAIISKLWYLLRIKDNPSDK